jgi:hypothetical protein
LAGGGRFEDEVEDFLDDCEAEVEEAVVDCREDEADAERDRAGVRVVGGESGTSRTPPFGVPVIAGAGLVTPALPGDSEIEDDWSPKLSDGISAESRWNDEPDESDAVWAGVGRPDSWCRRGEGAGDWFGGVTSVSTASSSSSAPFRSRTPKLARLVTAILAPGDSSSSSSRLLASSSRLPTLALLRKTEKCGCASRTRCIVWLPEADSDVGE